MSIDISEESADYKRAHQPFGSTSTAFSGRAEGKNSVPNLHVGVSFSLLG